MSKAKSKKPNSPFRVPKLKSKFGLHIPKIAMPHEEIIITENQASKKNLDDQHNNILSSHTTLSSMTRQNRPSSLPSPTLKVNEKDIKDKKDVENPPGLPVLMPSTVQFLPESLFTGKDKNLYEILYSMTQGSIEKKKKVRMSKNKLMKLAGIGSRVTFDLCVERLKSKSLLKLQVLAGEHEGNEFEIIIPQFLVSENEQSTRLLKVNDDTYTNVTNHSSTINSNTPTTLTTLTTLTTSDIELNNCDDFVRPNIEKEENEKNVEEFSEMIEILSRINRKFSEKNSNKNCKKDWKALADLLVWEVESIAKTKVITNVPKFLAEHLRRLFDEK